MADLYDDDDDDLVDEIGSANKPPPEPAARPDGADANQKPAKPRKSPMYYAMAIGLSVLTCLLFYETVFLIGVGMLPTGVAYLIDTHPRRYAAKTVAWTNLAGALVVALDLWSGDRSLDSTIALLQDPLNWIIMLGAAAIGWIIHYIVPGMVLRYLDISLSMRRRATQDKLNKLIMEWGTDVRQSAPLDELEALEAINQASPSGEEEQPNDEDQEPGDNARP